MNDLSIHISGLLRKYGYAVIPGFGGFVSHHVHSCIKEKGRIIIPPSSEIGFSENLNINDGLLVQSYMEYLGISYSAAEKKVKAVVHELNDSLHEEGKVDFAGIGTLSVTMNGVVVFEDYKNTVVDTSFYGLENIHVRLLTELDNINIPENKSVARRKISLGTYVQYAAACVVVIMLYFLSSVSIDNSSLYRYDNMASMIPQTNIFYGTTTLSSDVFIEEDCEKTSAIDKKYTESVDLIKLKDSYPDNIVAKKEIYHIIIASLGLEDNYNDIIEDLKDGGYRGARVLKGDGRIRIAIKSFENFEEALKEAENIRNNTQYKDAWVLTKKI